MNKEESPPDEPVNKIGLDFFKYTPLEFVHYKNFMKSKNIVCSKCFSFDELESSTEAYFFSLTPQQRLDTVQYLREQLYKIKGIKPQRLNKKICVKGVLEKSESRKRF